MPVVTQPGSRRAPRALRAGALLVAAAALVGCSSEATRTVVLDNAAASVASGAASSSAAASTGGLVSVTFDDGWANQYQNAFPVMVDEGVVGTFYLISSYMDADPYMSTEQAKALAAAGNELGSHTVDHQDLSEMTTDELTYELSTSKDELEEHLGVDVESIAYPYGGADDTVTAQVEKYYTSGRSTTSGLNVTGEYDPYNLTIGYVLAETTADDVQGWIDEAEASGSWLILCYHEVGGSTTGGDAEYNTTTANFTSEMEAVADSDLTVVTVSQGVARTS